MRVKNDHQQGFTLIEVMIALFVFSVGILAVSALQISSMRANSQARMISQASSLASESIERLLALPYDHASLKDQNKDKEAGLGKKGGDADFTNTTAGCTVSWNIAENFMIDGSKTIRVIVQYTERGVQKEVVLERVRHDE